MHTSKSSIANLNREEIWLVNLQELYLGVRSLHFESNLTPTRVMSSISDRCLYYWDWCFPSNTRRCTKDSFVCIWWGSVSIIAVVLWYLPIHSLGPMRSAYLCGSLRFSAIPSRSLRGMSGWCANCSSTVLKSIQVCPFSFVPVRILYSAVLWYLFLCLLQRRDD